ncbi:MAG: ATP-binding protein, partial [Ktedonobacterales bacterium]
HGVPVTVMRAQAAAIGLLMRCVPTTPATFEATFLALLGELAAEGVRGAIFGNIHLADVRGWYEERVRAAGLRHIEPLWGEASSALVRETLARGYRSLLTCVDTTRAKPEWLGQTISTDLVAEFERAGIDACGERGEYHTLVTDGPLFRHPLAIQTGTVHREGDFQQLDVQEAAR